MHELATPRTLTRAVIMAALLVPTGCVRRTVSFTTIPEGARLFLNDRDVGRTPATVEFTWYGNYDVVYRLAGHQAVHTQVALEPPWYQYFPFDFFAEVLWPGELHDRHVAPTQTMTVQQPADPEALSERALRFRDQALMQGGNNEPQQEQ